MTFAEDKTYEYIRRHHRAFRHIRAREILPYLHCLTISDQDRLRAEVERFGNSDTLWNLFASLRGRCGWVESLIQALRECEHTQLAEEVAGVYQSYLPQRQSLPTAQTPGPSAPAETFRGTPNGYREEEEPSYPAPVQETLGQSSKAATQTPSSGTVQPGTGDPEPPSDMAAHRPPTTRGQPQEQDKELGNESSGGGNPTPLRGPVSPTVSFQPLSRSTSRASRLPTPPGSSTGLSPTSLGLTNTGLPGDQAEATIWPKGIGVPTSPGPSKVPINPKPLGTVPTAVPTGPPPSKLPVNSARAGAGASKVPTGLAPDHSKTRSAVPSKVPALQVPSSKGGNRAAEEVPRVDSGAHWHSELELSKPGELNSQPDSTFSGCSEDLAISYSVSLGSGDTRQHGPEENEYQSDSIRMHVTESPSIDLMAGNSRPTTSNTLQEDELPKRPPPPKASWATWLLVAMAGGLLAALLGVMHRRHLLQ